MKIHSLNTGLFKLDGGAMFGVVPKVLWERTNPSDANNLCTWAMRSLLIEDGNRLTLIDTGIGNKQSEKFFSHFFLHGADSLDSSLKKIGFHREDITDVLLTHLHFDHCGGAIEYDPRTERFEPAFKNANFWSNEKHWKWATSPNTREKASFLSENILPIQQSGQLQMINRNDDFVENAYPGMDLLFVDGHTDSMMIPHINYQGKKIVFMADLLPSVGHIPLPFVMGYDTRPLLTLDEKKLFLDKAAEENYYLYFQHDSENEMCTLKMTEKGPRLDRTFHFSEIFN